MGANLWFHFGSYHPDLTCAVELLYEKVVTEDDYRSLWLPPDQEHAAIESYLDQHIAEFGLAYTLERYSYNAKGIVPTSRADLITVLRSDQQEPPRTIREIIQYHGVEGTQSILDYAHSAYDYEPLPFDQIAARLRPISEEGLQRVFGTPTPTHAAIEGHITELWHYLISDESKWEGDYIIIYDNGTPIEWFVIGMTFG
jgi:hypothetical protein